ncbi:phosphocholine-specific phospholipase C [Sphingomonas sp. RS6]
MATTQDRRSFIRTMMAAAGGATTIHPSIARALAIPADRRSGTIADVAHVVILTQENRAFDHYFGTMRGVHGFGDRFAVPAPPLPGAPRRTVLVQPNEHDGATPALLAPFRLDTATDFRLYRPLGTPHGFTDSQAAWDNGRMGEWPRHKHNHAMAHFTRDDLPFQFALAEAFTICDAYHCALHLSTNPNRLYLWSGTHDPLGRRGGPAIDNGYDTLAADPRGHGGYAWTTYPERLMAAGIDFQLYQDMDDNFTDNPLVGFARYRQAARAADADGEPGSLAVLGRRSVKTCPVAQFVEDAKNGRLPAVSWIIGPAETTEHPSASTPLQGADYIAGILDALTANPEVWARTVFLVNFDENDGLFDHVPAPAPPARTTSHAEGLAGGTTVSADDEYHMVSQGAEDAAYLGRPYGLGPRVPMYVLSPWSKGGYVASEVFDHTSVIRFLEARFGVHEPNISAWRRAVCGDLTSCFDFASPDRADFRDALPPTRALSERAAALHEVAPPVPGALAAPVQEAGVRRRRPTPYRLDVRLAHDAGTPTMIFANAGTTRAAVFHVYDVDRLDGPPARYTVEPGKQLEARLPGQAGARDLFVVGPNGFHRRLRGAPDRFAVRFDVVAGRPVLTITNVAATAMTIRLGDCAYGQPDRRFEMAPGSSRPLELDLADSHGWYDVELVTEGQSWRLAGHVEDGQPSFSDPAAGGAGALTV